MAMQTYIQIQTTCAQREIAERIAQHLITNHLAACIQIFGPITSIYRWQEQIESTTEWLLLIKTMGEKYHEVEAAIQQLHSYEVPEIIALPVVTGSTDYLNWVTQECRSETV